MKTFGSGLAYPVRSNDGMVLPEAGKVNPRADSFSLYMNYVANTLLSNLLPKSRLQNSKVLGTTFHTCLGAGELLIQHVEQGGR